MTRTVLLGREIELAYGKGLPQRSRIPGRFPVFGSNGQVDTHEQPLIKGPGIIIGRKGSVGEVIWTDDDFWPIDTTYYVKLKNKEDNLKYWYYQLKTLGLNLLNSHSAIPGLNRDVAYAKQIIKRTPDEQKRIADILGMIDEKIELNRRMNETLEQMGQALFRHYFIDNPEAEKWEEAKIGELVNIKGGGTPSTKNADFWNGDISWTSPRDLTGKNDAYLLDTDKKITEAGLAKISSGLLPSETLLLSSRAPIGYVALAGLPLAINQGYIAFLPDAYLSNHYMYFWLYQNMERIKNAANGSTFMEISKSAFRSITTMKPDEKSLLEFGRKVKGVFEAMRNNQEQIQNLTTLRDTLLPRLINGKVKV